MTKKHRQIIRQTLEIVVSLAVMYVLIVGVSCL